AAFREGSPDALILLTPVPDPEHYGVAELGPADGSAPGRVVRLVEKPAQPHTDLALVGVYMFTAQIHDAARAISPSGRGELEITGARARLTDCYIGPYTAIGEDCEIARSEVEHSILLAGCTVSDLDGRMESSLLGRNVTVRRAERQPRAYGFVVGDNSDISIP